MLQALTDRANALKNEIEKAKQNIVHFTEQLEQAKSNYYTVVGHINEVAHLLSIAQKNSEPVNPPVPLEAQAISDNI